MVPPVHPADGSTDLLDIANRFAEAKCLLVADELGLFDLLQEGPLGADEVSTKLSVREHAAPDFLSVLAALGVLDRTDDGRFRNSATATRYLIPGGEEYLGSVLKYYNNTLYNTWENLGELLVQPGDGAGVDGNARENFSAILDDPPRAREMLAMMAQLNAFMGPALVDAVDWTGHATVADLGGSIGRHVTDIVSAVPHLRGLVFDLPKLRPYAEETFAEAGLTDRVDFHPGDFFNDTFPPADVYVFGHILHNFAPRTRYSLVAKAYESLRPGGVLAVVDRMVDEERAVMARLIESLHLYVISDGGGSDYRPSECEDYLSAAGFTRVTVRALTGKETLVMGHRES